MTCVTLVGDLAHRLSVVALTRMGHRGGTKSPVWQRYVGDVLLLPANSCKNRGSTISGLAQRFGNPGLFTRLILVGGGFTEIMHELCQFKAEFFKALAHTLRIRVLDALSDEEGAVNELGFQLSVQQRTLYQPLAILRNMSIILGRKNGSKVLYSVRDPAVFRLWTWRKRSLAIT